jgi:2'-5' RNA ligase
VSLFVAVWPTSPVVDHLVSLQRPDVPGVRWTAPEQLHCTLAFLGTPPTESWRDLLVPLGDAASVINGPITAVLGPSTRTIGRQVLCIPVSGLDHLANAMVETLSPLVPTLDRREFRGHVTLARARRRQQIPDELLNVHAEQEFHVIEITLVFSRSVPGGVEYDLLGGAPLRACRTSD